MLDLGRLYMTRGPFIVALCLRWSIDITALSERVTGRTPVLTSAAVMSVFPESTRTVFVNGVTHLPTEIAT